MLQKAFDLTDEVLRVSIGADSTDLEEDWAKVVFLHLLRSRDALYAIRLVVATGLRGPSMVLHRYIFELAVNLMFLQNDIENRVPLYLKHSGFPSTPDEIAEIDDKLDSLRQDKDYSGIMELLTPRWRRRPWKPLKEMCEELKMIQDYDALYTSTSEVAHGGANAMPLEILQFWGYNLEGEHIVAGTLIGSLLLYIRVVRISLEVFPDLRPNFEVNNAWHESFARLQQEILEAVDTDLEWSDERQHGRNGADHPDSGMSYDHRTVGRDTTDSLQGEPPGHVANGNTNHQAA